MHLPPLRKIDRYYPNLVVGFVGFWVGLAVADVLHHFHPFVNATEHGVLVVQPGLFGNTNKVNYSVPAVVLHITHRWQHRDEELTSVSVRTRVGHTDRVRSIVLQRRAELILELSAPDGLSTGTRSRGIARLDHETLDNPMENVPIVVAILGVHTEIFHRFGTLFAEQTHVDVPHGGVDDRVIVQFLRT